MQTYRIRLIRPDFVNCIHACRDCHDSCLETLIHVLRTHGNGVSQEFAHLLLTCAEVCQTTANLMSLGELLDRRLALVCAELCAQCTTACEAFAQDGQVLTCAQLCRTCADCSGQLADPNRPAQPPLQESPIDRAKRHERQRDEVDESSWESFPASDPPALSKDPAP